MGECGYVEISGWDVWIKFIGLNGGGKIDFGPNFLENRNSLFSKNQRRLCPICIYFIFGASPINLQIHYTPNDLHHQLNVSPPLHNATNIPNLKKCKKLWKIELYKCVFIYIKWHISSV